MTDPVGIGAGLVPIALEKLDAFRRRNEVRVLLRLAAAEVAGTPGVGPGDMSRVRDKVNGLGIDPWIMGGVRRLLDDGDIAALPALTARLRELIQFGDALDELDLGLNLDPPTG